jgi:hypothetical protein
MIIAPMTWLRARRGFDQPAHGKHSEQPPHAHLAGGRVDGHLGEHGAEGVSFPGRLVGHERGSIDGDGDRRCRTGQLLAQLGGGLGDRPGPRRRPPRTAGVLRR